MFSTSSDINLLEHMNLDFDPKLRFYGQGVNVHMKISKAFESLK